MRGSAVTELVVHLLADLVGSCSSSAGFLQCVHKPHIGFAQRNFHWESPAWVFEVLILWLSVADMEARNNMIAENCLCALPLSNYTRLVASAESYEVGQLTEYDVNGKYLDEIALIKFVHWWYLWI